MKIISAQPETPDSIVDGEGGSFWFIDGLE